MRKTLLSVSFLSTVFSQEVVWKKLIEEKTIEYLYNTLPIDIIVCL